SPDIPKHAIHYPCCSPGDVPQIIPTAWRMPSFCGDDQQKTPAVAGGGFLRRPAIAGRQDLPRVLLLDASPHGFERLPGHFGAETNDVHARSDRLTLQGSAVPGDLADLAGGRVDRLAPHLLA